MRNTGRAPWASGSRYPLGLLLADGRPVAEHHCHAADTAWLVVATFEVTAFRPRLPPSRDPAPRRYRPVTGLSQRPGLTRTSRSERCRVDSRRIGVKLRVSRPGIDTAYSAAMVRAFPDQKDALSRGVVATNVLRERFPRMPRTFWLALFISRATWSEVLGMGYLVDPVVVANEGGTRRWHLRVRVHFLSVSRGGLDPQRVAAAVDHTPSKLRRPSSDRAGPRQERCDGARFHAG